MPNGAIDFNIQNYMPLLATAYGEAASEDYDSKREVLSTMLNRAESGKAEFGADTGKLTDVLKRGYYAYSQQSPKFKEAMAQKFPDKESEDSFKEIVAIFSGMLKGKVPRTDSVFFLTPQEVEKVKKTKAMNMDLLEQTGKSKVWNFYKYKTPSAKAKKASRTSK